MLTLIQALGDSEVNAPLWCVSRRCGGCLRTGRDGECGSGVGMGPGAGGGARTSEPLGRAG